MEQFFESAVEFIIPTAIGLVLILLGRRIFWALGALAFATVAMIIVGILLLPHALDITTAEMYINVQFTEQAPPTPFAIAGVIGAIIGIFFTLRFPKAASAVVGFSLGIFFIIVVFELFAIAWPEPVRRSVFIIVGTIIAGIAIRQPAETIIILSTLLGSQMILDAAVLDPNSPLSAFLWLMTMLVGIVYQTSVLRREQRKRMEQKSVATAPVA